MPLTRYAIQHTDGRFLAIAYSGHEPLALWTDQDHRWTGETYTHAVMIGLRLTVGDIDWEIVAV